MTEIPLWLVLAVACLNLLLVVVLLIVWLRQRGAGETAAEMERLAGLMQNISQTVATGHERLERELRREISETARGARQEQSTSLATFQQSVVQQNAEFVRTQNAQIDALAQQLTVLQTTLADTLTNQIQSLSEANARRLSEVRTTLETQLTQLQQGSATSLAAFQQSVVQQNAEFVRTQNAQLDAFSQQLTLLQKTLADTLTTQIQGLSESNARRLSEVRATLESQLAQLQQSNATKLDEMRHTVDEKLQTTLESRLGESFKQVAERLEQVHKGLGEMHSLAQGVGDLKHLLTNVKTRGIFGEAQLGALLEQVLAPEQYAEQVATRPDTRNAVDFAIRLPGRSGDGTPVWLPIDAKFPTTDYEALLEAQQRADAAAVEIAARALETRIRFEARSIREKYIEPPHTTDFAILFLPSEGLYAEVLRRPGLVEVLQREYRVTLAGPTTLLAMLNSLQMGFRTLALEKRSSEVWQVLGAVKTEFLKFGDVLSKVKKQTQTVLNTLDETQTRTNVLTRKLRDVEALPEADAQQLLPNVDVPDDSEDLPQ